jgi:D-glycero-beta-D-manno-heptose-7-phosphate kinase
MNVPALPDFRALRVAVAGDLIADHYLYAQPTRLSREAPVMVLRHERDTIGAGGAANVARNLRALGANVRLIGAVGRDASGRELVDHLRADGIDVELIESIPGWTTPTKTRVLAAEPRRSPHQVLRIDREPSEPVSSAQRQRVANAVRELEEEIDVLLLSDYEYGVVSSELAAVARDFARQGGVAVLDPRRDVELFRGMTALTPNIGELARFTRMEVRRLDDPRELQEAARALLELVGARYLLVTRGNLGMALFGRELDPRGVAVDASGTGAVTDVSGAGDTAAAVFALALGAKLEPHEAMQLANAAAGVVVMETGTAVCTPHALECALGCAPAPIAWATSSV